MKHTVVSQASHEPSLPKAVFVMGPTAAGKTDLAINLCHELRCELVSVDSALIYRRMDIGTAKPDRETLQRAPHALIDILDPWESYSVADFYQDALREMQAIVSRGNTPVLVGGTMMYFRVLRDGIAALPSADSRVREEINAEARQHGWPYIHQQLVKVDPESAARIRPNDSQRLQRALEVYRVSGRTMTEFWHRQKHGSDGVDPSKKQTGNAEICDYTYLEVKSGKRSDASPANVDVALPGAPFDIVSLAIAPQDRSVLHQRIAHRFQMMLDGGFIAEVEALRADKRIERDMPSMRCVGYRQVWDYLENESDYHTMQEKGVIATRQLAKRQLTWLRSWDGLNWLDTFDEKNLDKALKIIKKDAP